MSGLKAQVHRLQARLLERANAPADASAVPLVLDGQVCGSMDAPLASRIAGAVPGFLLRGGALRLGDDALDADGRSRSMERAARWLLLAGLVTPWRDEPL